MTACRPRRALRDCVSRCGQGFTAVNARPHCNDIAALCAGRLHAYAYLESTGGTSTLFEERTAKTVKFLEDDQKGKILGRM